MIEKYLIVYQGITYKVKTKQDIMKLFNIPLYIVNKAINKIDSGCHHVFYLILLLLHVRDYDL